MHTVFATLGLSTHSDFSRDLPAHLNPKGYASNIAHSVGYFMRPEMGLLGPQLFAFPMGVALMYFLAFKDPGNDEERRLLGASIGRVTEIGFTLGTFLSSLQAASNPETRSTSPEDAWIARAQAWFKVDSRSQSANLAQGHRQPTWQTRCPILTHKNNK